MRKRLAVARSMGNHDSDYLVCAASAFGDALGGLTLRAIDNGDRTALLRVKSVYAREAASRCHIPYLVAAKAAHRVLSYLQNSLCEVCNGHGNLSHENGVVRACSACNASGFATSKPGDWGKIHEDIFSAALMAISANLRKTRDSMECE